MTAHPPGLHVTGPINTPPGGSLSEPPLVSGRLDPVAVERLRQLDPTGEAGVLGRVLRAYEVSLTRQLDDLAEAREAAQMERIGRLAHTLKSSSASVGAMRLSVICADVERGVRQQQQGPAIETQLEALVHEAQAVREAVRAMLPP